MDYSSTYLNSTIRCHARNMILHINLDTAYISLSNDRRRSRHLYLNNNPATTKIIPSPKDNGIMLTKCTTLKIVMSSVADTEVETLHYNVISTVPMRRTLVDLGHPQGTTPANTDTSTASGVFNKKSVNATPNFGT